VADKIIEKVFPSDPELLPEIETFVMDIAKDYNLDEDKHNALALSVAEAASNSMLHGNKLDINKKVQVTINISDKKMIVKFKDEGEGFDRASVPDPTAPENILKDSGRGIHIMSTFLDDLRYEFSSEGTTAILELSL